MWIKIPADEELDAAKDRITELEAGLERYGRHERSCGCHEFELAGRIGLIELHGAEYKCTCGLDALKGD